MYPPVVIVPDEPVDFINELPRSFEATGVAKVDFELRINNP